VQLFIVPVESLLVQNLGSRFLLEGRAMTPLVLLGVTVATIVLNRVSLCILEA
jgi:hypothetical protein